MAWCLAQREEAVTVGEAQFLDWDQAKKKIRKSFIMKIRLLDNAIQDLIEGFDFYEKQENGLGVYFIDTLFSDFDSPPVCGVNVA